MLRAMIALNGPAGSGKTHFEHFLKHTIAEYSGVIPFTVRITADAIWPMMLQERVVEPSEYIDYWHFKAECRDARQITIGFANMKRARDPLVFLKYLMSDSPMRKHEVVIFDNMGMFDEYTFFCEQIRFVSILSILTPWEYRHGRTQPGRRFPVPVGQQYPGDIRYQLPPFEGWWAIDSEHMIERTKRNIDDAAHARFDSAQALPETIKGWRCHVLGIVG